MMRTSSTHEGTGRGGDGTAGEIRLDPVGAAVEAMAQGRAVVVVDDADRENEGDIVFAAEHATPALMGFTIRHTSGVVCVPMTGARADAMRLPPMVDVNEDSKGTAYTVTCDARHGVSTGISAADRALTARVLADPEAGPGDITRPGHVLPLRAAEGGVAVRRGHTEAAVELCSLAGLEPVGEGAQGGQAHHRALVVDELGDHADRHGIPLVSIEDLAAQLQEDRR